ncbi:hypothetical protein BJV74DRAFT_49871 [Russula compacta]|nr:hypothetical protein BJV74DRAFT_49871 [Russula compacta]
MSSSSPMNQGILSSLKRQQVARNRSNNATSPSSKRANRLPVLHEHSAMEGAFNMTLLGVGAAVPPIPPPLGSSKKRRSRYSKIEVTRGSSPTLPDNFLSAAPRAAPCPPSSSVSARRQLTSLSAFDIIIDNPPPEPASLVSETPGASSTPPRPRGTPHWSPPRSCSPTPSLTSTSACSSAEVPRTPDGSDDEWPSPRNPRETLARPRFARHQLMLIKSTPSPSDADTSPEDSFEFTLEPFSFLPQSEDEEEEQNQEEEEQDVLWYSRELGQVVSLFPRPPSYGVARPDSLPHHHLAALAQVQTNRLLIARSASPFPLSPTRPGRADSWILLSRNPSLACLSASLPSLSCLPHLLLLLPNCRHRLPYSLRPESAQLPPGLSHHGPLYASHLRSPSRAHLPARSSPWTSPTSLTRSTPGPSIHRPPAP